MVELLPFIFGCIVTVGAVLSFFMILKREIEELKLRLRKIESDKGLSAFDPMNFSVENGFVCLKKKEEKPFINDEIQKNEIFG